MVLATLSCKEDQSCSQAGVKMIMKISARFLMIIEAITEKHKVKIMHFFQTDKKRERNMAEETFIGSSVLWGSHSWAHSLIHRAWEELDKNNGTNQLFIKGTAAFCLLFSMERNKQSLQSPLAIPSSS